MLLNTAKIALFFLNESESLLIRSLHSIIFIGLPVRREPDGFSRLKISRSKKSVGFDTRLIQSWTFILTYHNYKIAVVGYENLRAE